MAPHRYCIYFAIVGFASLLACSALSQERGDPIGALSKTSTSTALNASTSAGRRQARSRATSGKKEAAIRSISASPPMAPSFALKRATCEKRHRRRPFACSQAGN